MVPFPSTDLGRVAVLLGVMLLSYAVRAQSTWVIDNGTIAITEYDCSAARVTIPETIDGLPATRIDTEAFYACPTLTSIVIPNSVTCSGPAAGSKIGNH